MNSKQKLCDASLFRKCVYALFFKLEGKYYGF